MLIFLLFCGFSVGAKTISSECDISDINVPFEYTNTKAEIGTNLDIKAKSAILLEPYTGKILYEQNCDEKLPPASITKIMPLLLVMEALERGDITLETMVSASEHACSMGGSQIWLEPGEGMTVDHLLKATVIASANDACVALGEQLAGSEEGFVALMNKRAKELGMNNTHFVNCTGLDAEGHLTTAHDVALMSAQLIKFPLIKKYSTVWMDTLRDGESELVNTNKLVRFYKGTTGLKTGTTSGAKYCLSATAERDGMELVAVVMAGESSDLRFSGAKKLLDYGFANYSFKEIGAELKENEISLLKGVKKTVGVSCDEKVNVLLPKTEKSQIVRQTEWNKKITAPIKKGDEIGRVNVYVGKTQVGTLPITASEAVEKLTFWVALRWILGGITTL
ncbi:MAG: D-alanyl-D-alanine carboxypeptidase [Ruminococcaceae bacterium]|nr:D-alanyl-D-alanine carboxypeptidase [Oscillospiraceae bacterium]